MRLGLRQCVLAAAEADLEPQPFRARRESAKRVCSQREVEAQARQRQFQQRPLPRSQSMAAAAAVEPVDRRLQRPKARFSSATRSVLSQVKVPFSSSGSRPK